LRLYYRGIYFYDSRYEFPNLTPEELEAKCRKEAEETLAAYAATVERKAELKARISELKQIRPPEQYKDYAKIAGREDCVICGFNSEKFRKHIDDRLAALQGPLDVKA
jgi:hypothetical protein